MSVPKRLPDKNVSVDGQDNEASKLPDLTSGADAPITTNELGTPKNKGKGSLISHGGERGISNISSNPLKDPTVLGTFIRIQQLNVNKGLANTFIGTYGDGSRDGDGKPGSAIAREIARNKDPRDRAKGKHLTAYEPYYDADQQGYDPDQFSKWLSGVFVIDSLTMTSPSYVTRDAEGEEVVIGGTEILIQNIIMSVSLDKNIVEDYIAGRDGSIKQYISLKDHVVDFQGYILGYDGLGGHLQGERPHEAIEQFARFMRRPTQVEITCDFLNTLGIDRGVVYGFKMPQEIGVLDHQRFMFKLKEDRPFEIFINK